MNRSLSFSHIIVFFPSPWNGGVWIIFCLSLWQDEQFYLMFSENIYVHYIVQSSRKIYICLHHCILVHWMMLLQRRRMQLQHSVMVLLIVMIISNINEFVIKFNSNIKNDIFTICISKIWKNSTLPCDFRHSSSCTVKYREMIKIFLVGTLHGGYEWDAIEGAKQAYRGGDPEASVIW